MGEGQSLKIVLNKKSLLPSYTSMNQIKVKVYEACATESQLEWKMLGGIIPMNGFRLPKPSMSCNKMYMDQAGHQPTSPYSLVLLKVIIDPSDDEMIRKLQMLANNEIGIWSHVLLGKYNSETNNGQFPNIPNIPSMDTVDMASDQLVMLWNTPGVTEYHPVMLDSNALKCPCLKSEAEQDGSLEESSMGKKVLDNYLYGGINIICYDERQNRKQT